MAAALHTVFYDSSLFYQIFALASPSAKISEQLIEKVKSSGLGKLTSWSPQQFILNHPVLYPFFFTCLGSVLTIKSFFRQPDGSSPTVVLTVLQNLLEAVSHCKIFLRFITQIDNYLFVEFAGPFSQTSQLRLHISQKIST